MSWRIFPVLHTGYARFEMWQNNYIVIPAKAGIHLVLPSFRENIERQRWKFNNHPRSRSYGFPLVLKASLLGSKG